MSTTTPLYPHLPPPPHPGWAHLPPPFPAGDQPNRTSSNGVGIVLALLFVACAIPVLLVAGFLALIATTPSGC